MNKFNAMIAPLVMPNVYSEEKIKKSMLIRSLPESLSFLCTVASSQPDMTVETLEALIRAELDRNKNPNNLQSLNSNTSITPKANQAKKQQGNGQRFNRNGNKGGRKKVNCHYCGKDGQFKRVCRKRLQDRNYQRNNKPNNAPNSNNSNNQNDRNNFGFNNRNNSTNSNNQGNNPQSYNDIQTMVNQTLTNALRNFSSSNSGIQPTSFNHSCGGFMA